MKVIYLGGWSYSPQVFEIFEKKTTYTWQFLDWRETLDDLGAIERAIGKTPCLLLGWSLGGFLLYPFLHHDNVKGGVFIAIGSTFVKSPSNPYGQEIEVLEKMIAAIKKNAQVVVKQFQRLCGLVTIDHFHQAIDLDVVGLLAGLEYLKKITLPSLHLNKKHYLMHGKNDRILDWRSSLILGEQPGAICQFLEGKHNPFDDIPSILHLIDQFD